MQVSNLQTKDENCVYSDIRYGWWIAMNVNLSDNVNLIDNVNVIDWRKPLNDFVL